MKWLCLLPALGLTSCASLPARQPDQAAVIHPKHWQASRDADKEVLANWLDSFADAGLHKCVTTALTYNYDLQVAAANVQAAREQAIIQGAERRPFLNVSAAYQHGQSTDGRLHHDESGAFSGLFSLSWEWDVWGRIRAAQQAAEYNADAIANDFNAARLSLAARTAQSYIKLIEADLQAKVAEQSVKDRRTIVELVRGRFIRGLTRGLDLRLVLTDLANAEAQLADARNQVQLSIRQLQVLSGAYPDGLRTSNAALPDLPKTIAAGLPSDLLARRPDVMAAFARLQAADARLLSAEKALLPRIALTAEGGTQSTALRDIADPRAALWNLALGLTQPILAGGRLQGDIRVNRAGSQAALNDYRRVALVAFQEVEQSLAAEHWLRDQEQALKAAVAQTEESRKLAVHSYQQGMIEILTLLDSFRSTLDSQSAYLAVRRQLLHNRINLYLALGGGIG